MSGAGDGGSGVKGLALRAGGEADVSATPGEPGRPRYPHALIRAAERYDVRRDLVDLEVMAAICRDREPERKYHDVEAHIIEYRGRAMPVIYRRALGVVVTVLPQSVKAPDGRFWEDWRVER